MKKISSDAKPRRDFLPARGLRNYPSAPIRQKRQRGIERSRIGAIQMADVAPSGRKTGIVVGSTGPQGGISTDPTHILAWRIRKALTMPSLAPVLIYDAAGRHVATVDPVTRKRTDVPS